MRFTFVVAEGRGGSPSRPISDLRALQGRGERRSPDHGRLKAAPTIEAIGSVAFYDFIWFDGFAKNPSFPQGGSLRGLPKIDPGIGVTLPAED